MHLFVDNLTNVDFSYLDPERGMLGETWLAHVQLDGSLDEQGMVCDFGVVKKTLRNWLDEELDHRLAIPVNSPNLTLVDEGDYLDITWTYNKAGDAPKTIRCRSPRQAIALVEAESISPASTAQWCIAQLMPMFPASLQTLALQFTTEAIAGAFYHYSHGLKKHGGNCQRIAHGHRSSIEILKNGERSASLEADWAERWNDIYIGSTEDLVAEDEQQLHFAYQAEQGDFSLSMPKADCYMITTDSTVELIADHIAGVLKDENPDSAIAVKAFEGIGKGAKVSRS